MRSAETILAIIRAHPAWSILESRMTRKCHVRFGGGPMEKYRRNTRQLASGLPNRVDTRPWPTRAAARLAVFEWLEVWYNRQRRHSALAYHSPVSYEDPTLLLSRSIA